MTIAMGMFYIAFILNLIIFYYSISLYRQIKRSLLANVTLFAGLSSLVFSLHHLGENLLEKFTMFIIISESLEGVAAILLLVAVYYIYKISNEVFLN